MAAGFGFTPAATGYCYGIACPGLQQLSPEAYSSFKTPEGTPVRVLRDKKEPIEYTIEKSATEWVYVAGRYTSLVILKDQDGNDYRATFVTTQLDANKNPVTTIDLTFARAE